VAAAAVAAVLLLLLQRVPRQRNPLVKQRGAAAAVPLALALALALVLALPLHASSSAPHAARAPSGVASLYRGLCEMKRASVPSVAAPPSPLFFHLLYD